MMTSATLVTLAASWLAGLGLLGALRPTRVRTRLEHHATALLVGVALATIVVMHAVILFGPLSSTAGRVVLGVLAVGGLPFALRRGPAPEPCAKRPGVVGVLGLAVLFAFAAFAVFSAASMPMHVFDSVFHFSYKAKLIYHEGFGTDAWTDVVGPVGRIITHPDYAPGIAVLNALVGYAGGRFDEDAFRALCSIFVLVPAAWLWVALRPRGFAAAFCGTLLWISLPILYYTKLPDNNTWAGSAWAFSFGTASAKARFPEYVFGPADGQTLDGGADIALAAFLFGAFWHLSRMLPAARLASDRVDVVAGGVLLGGALLAKNEGLALTAVLALAFVSALAGGALAGRRTRDDSASDRRSVRPLPGLAGVLALAFACGSGWLAIRGRIPAIDEDYPSRLTPANVAQNLPRLVGDELEPGVLTGFLETFTHVLHWNLLWPLFFAAVLWSLVRPGRFLRSPGAFAAIVFAGAAALYALILLVTPWHLGILFTTVIPGRLLLHVAPIVVLGTVALLWRFEHEERSNPAPSPT